LIEGLAIPQIDNFKINVEGEASHGGELFNSVCKLLEDPFFVLSLNSEYQIRDEELINSSIASGSKLVLPYQTMLQSDIIVNVTAPYSGIHWENGLALILRIHRNSWQFVTLMFGNGF